MGIMDRWKANKSGPAQLFLREGDTFLPNFCRGQGLLTVIVISELLALMISVADSGLQNFDWVKLAKVSLLSLWIVLLSAVVLCFANRLLTGVRLVTAATLSFLLILMVTLLCGAVSEGIMWWYSAPLAERSYNIWNIAEYLSLIHI